ncbi:MAG: hypothetical protein AB1Z98_00035 [Nannocystaceae bacterium]
MIGGFVRSAAWWNADAGPPQADLLPRPLRARASLPTRILAHVLDRLDASVPLGELPWVVGSPPAAHDRLAQGSPLRAVLGPSAGLSLVHAGPATVPMALLEALARLNDHDAVLVAFAHDATPPYSEAMAAAFVLAARDVPDDRLVLEVSRLHRAAADAPDRRDSQSSFDAALRLAHAASVGQPTSESFATTGPDPRECWGIELRAAY